MIKVIGKYNSAKIFTDKIEKTAIDHIQRICDSIVFKDTKIRIMPDVHDGNGCVIGATMTIKDKIVPDLVGDDIGCGVYVCKIEEDDIDFERLDEVIKEYIPSGFESRETPHIFAHNIDYNNIKACKYSTDVIKAELGMGTLGGGNHFIEVDMDSRQGICYLVIHTGSRYLGKIVCNFYQSIAKDNLFGTNKKLRHIQNQIIIDRYKTEGREQEIQEVLKHFKPEEIPKENAYIEGQDMDDYLNDMGITQFYASMNRKAIAYEIFREMNWTMGRHFETIHNYIDIYNRVVRKGAISARLGEKVVIPLNMKDGSLICLGAGNPDWNYSAPHGAGRVLTRSEAKENLSMEDFKDKMEGIYSTSICENTLDESPMAYKSMVDIVLNIGDTVGMLDHLKPVYNYKAH